jgi:hypothetical protein
VSVVVRHAVGEGIDHVVRKAGFEVGWEFERVEGRHRPGCSRSRPESACRFCSYVLGVGDPKPWLVACWFHATTVGWWASVGVYSMEARFVGRVLLFVELRGCCRVGSGVDGRMISACCGSRVPTLRCSMFGVVRVVGAR